MSKKKLTNICILCCSVLLMFGCSDSKSDGEKHEGVKLPEESSIVEQDSMGEEESTEEATGDIEDIYEIFDEYKIKKYHSQMRATVGINVRSGPAQSYERVGGISAGSIIIVTGQCVETGWYRLEYNGLIGFASNEYIGLAQEDAYILVLGDECPYAMGVKASYNGQIGWFFNSGIEYNSDDYEEIRREIIEDGYTVENEAVYIGTWRDVGDVMWLGYSKN